MAWTGTLLHIHIASEAAMEMEELSQATLVAGRGIEGDRYYLGTGTYSRVPHTFQLTLIEMEALEAIQRNDPPKQPQPLLISPADHRRNLTTRNVPLNHLAGRRFKVGECILQGREINNPCKYLEELLQLPVYLPLWNRSGLNCEIEVGGIIRPGDEITPL